LSRTGAIEATIDRASRFADAAKSALAVFRDSPLQRALLHVADYTVSRAK
jgi:octaprenyl-diphosphate synthase